MYAVLAYLAIFRLSELGMDHYQAMLVCFPPFMQTLIVDVTGFTGCDLCVEVDGFI